jgi:hypothetical protein
MKKFLFLALAAFTLGSNVVTAQSDYTFAAGLGLDLFSGVTLVGPSTKYFFAEEHAGLAEVMFETNLTTITALYEYHGAISGADGLKWFAGAGPSILFFGNGIGAEVALRPVVGLEYKINNVPLAFSFDWRPFIGLGDILGNEVGAFGLGIRYVIE